MKKTLLILFCVLLLTSCDWFSETWESVWSEDNERFIQAYTEILVVRSRYSDSTKANKEVEKVFEKHDYTEEEFREKYFTLAKNRDQFLSMIDSARSRAKEELIKIQAEELEKQKKEKESELSEKKDKESSKRDSSAKKEK
jgi:hypothetical protein